MHPLLRQTLDSKYFHVRGVNNPTLEFARSLGRVFEARLGDDPVIPLKIEGSDPVLTPYASCRCAELSLHTDYATFQTPPRFTITHCLHPDPHFPQMGRSIVIILDEVIERLSVDEPRLNHLLRNRPLPFRRNNEHERFHAYMPHFTILDSNDRVRFDRTLIVPVLEESTKSEDKALLDAVLSFEEMCHIYGERIETPLDRAEALIIDNHKVLHSRSECTVSRLGGNLSSREVNLVFLE